MSDSLRPHGLYGLYSLWNPPGKSTRVGSLSFLQGIFLTQVSSPGLPHCRWILYQLSNQGSPRILEWVAYPSSEDLPDPGIEPGSPALQVDSLPTELSWMDPRVLIKSVRCSDFLLQFSYYKQTSVLFMVCSVPCF